MAVKQPLSNQQHINQPPHWKAETKHESFTRHLEGLENPDCREIHSYESPLTEQHPHYKNRHVPQTYMVESLSVLWTVWSFWPWALSDSKGYISSLMNGWWCRGWLAAQKICWKSGERRRTRKEWKHIHLRTGQKKLISVLPSYLNTPPAL